MDSPEHAVEWGLRFARGMIMAATAFVLCWAQTHFPYPAAKIAVGFLAFSMVDGLQRIALIGLTFLLVLALVPPQATDAFTAWVTRLVAG